MTKKDFVFIAEVLAASKPEYRMTEDRAVWEKIARAFADRLVDENPRFDRSRFLSAAEYGH